MGALKPVVGEREAWKAIPGYEGLYEVSDLGRVRSLDRMIKLHHGGEYRRKGRIRKLVANNDGYLNVALSKEGEQRLYKVHRLVLEAFVGQPKEEQEACHNNGDRSDNRLSNLRWGTKKENMADIKKHGRNYWLNRTRCKHGHEYTPENTYMHPNGARICRTCNRKAAREYLSRGKALASSEGGDS